MGSGGGFPEALLPSLEVIFPCRALRSRSTARLRVLVSDRGDARCVGRLLLFERGQGIASVCLGLWRYAGGDESLARWKGSATGAEGSIGTMSDENTGCVRALVLS